MATGTQTVTTVKPTERSKRRIGRFTRLMLYLFLIVFTLTYLMPFISAIVTSVRTQDDLSLNGVFSIPQEIVFENYPQAWTQGGVSRYLLNSFIITIPALAGTIFLSSLSAFALARFKFPGNRLIYFMYVAGTMLPFQILLLPVFLLSNTVGLYNTYWGVIMIHIAFQLGFCTFVLSNYMKTLPKELNEAALVDGASVWMTFHRIIMPLMRPALAALTVLQVTWIYNDFFWALFLMGTGSKFPITSALNNLKGSFFADNNLLAAASLIIALPTLIVFFALQKQFVSGLTLGSTKG